MKMESGIITPAHPRSMTMEIRSGSELLENVLSVDPNTKIIIQVVNYGELEALNTKLELPVPGKILDATKFLGKNLKLTWQPETLTCFDTETSQIYAQW